MAWTQADVEALERAIADGRGARSIQFSDESITFSSPAEMLALLAAMKNAVATAAGGSSTRYAAFSKGA
jgi:hypothetical protein